MVQRTDFAARAHAIADEILLNGPDLVALQEVSLYRTGPPNACAGRQVPATTVAIDFLTLLQNALVARGLDYPVVAEVQNLDAQLCAAVSSESAIDVRLTDRDVILARAGLAVTNPRSGSYSSRAGFPVGGAALPVPRGWMTVDVAADLGNVRFAATHLEVESFPAVQAAQAAELVAAVAGGLGGLPVILAGDLNAGPELATVTTSYGDLLAAGYADPWPALNAGDPGPTCCFAEDLKGGTLTQRIDHTLLLGNLAGVSSTRVGLAIVARNGTLYPSDHAGVVTVVGVKAGGDGECPPCECDCDDEGREHHDCGLHLGQWCDEDHRSCGLHLGERCQEDPGSCGLHLGSACREQREDRDGCEDPGDSEKPGPEHADCGRHLGQWCDKDHQRCSPNRGAVCDRDAGDCGLHLGQECHRDRCGKEPGRTCPDTCQDGCQRQCKKECRERKCRERKCRERDGQGRCRDHGHGRGHDRDGRGEGGREAH